MMNTNLSNIAKTYAEDNNCGLPLTAEQLLNAVADKVADLEESSGGTTVVANSGESASEELQTLTVGDTTYEVPSGGDTVEANPSESGTEDLTSIKIDGSVYNIPSGGGSSSTLYRHFVQFRIGTVSAFVTMDYYNYSSTAFTSDTLLTELNGVYHSISGGYTASGGAYMVTSDGSSFTAYYTSGTTPSQTVTCYFVEDTVYEVS